MRLYVAGASAEIDRAERLIAAARSIGFKITFDWPAHIRRMGGDDSTMSAADKKANTAACVAAASTAPRFVLLEPVATLSKGAWIELGVAHMAGAHVLWVGPGATIFHALADHTVDTDADALRWLASMEGKNV